MSPRFCLPSVWPVRSLRRNAILVLIGIELMLNAANLNFIAFWRYGPNPEALTGMMFVIFSIAVAAAEAAVGLALIISIYRHNKTTDIDQVDSMRGYGTLFDDMTWIVRNLWLIPALPVLAAGLSALAKQRNRRFAASLAIGSMVLSLLLSLVAFAHVLHRAARE